MQVVRSNIYFYFSIYKVHLISAEGYKNAGVHLLIEKETGIIWASIKNGQDGLGIQNISDLVLYNIDKTKHLRKEQIKKFKMTEREIFKKYANLSENELNAKNNKEVYAKDDVKKNRCI